MEVWKAIWLEFFLDFPSEGFLMIFKLYNVLSACSIKSGVLQIIANIPGLFLSVLKVANPNILSLDFWRRRQQQRRRWHCRRFFSHQRRHWWPKSLSDSRWVIGRLKICVGDALGDVAQQISHRRSMKKRCRWVLTVTLSNRKKILYQ